MADTKKQAQEFPTYKGRPLVRCGDEIYYGNMEEPYVIRMQIKTKKEVDGKELPDKITVQLMATDPYLSPRKQLVTKPAAKKADGEAAEKKPAAKKTAAKKPAADSEK